MRIKDIGNINARVLRENTPQDYTFQYIDISSVSSSGQISLSEPMRYNESPSRARRIVIKNDVIVSTVRTYLRAIAGIDWNAKDIIASTGFAVISPAKKYDPAYVKYLMTSNAVVDEICKESTGVSYPAISSSRLSAIHIPVASLREQKNIATYLDKQINSINERICLRERELQTLIKLKQSEINSVVTRGLNPAVPMKDSGIDWIGQIPAHWQVRQLKSCVNINNGRDYKDIEVEEGEGYPVLGSGGVFAYASQYMYDGEVLLLGRKGTIDKPQYYNGKFWAVDTIFYAIPSRGVICKFMYYLSLTLPIKKFSTATALPSMTQTEYGKILVPLPPLEEQRAIVDYLDGKYERIDAFIANINAQIDKLKLLKKALINEVVTGQRPITQ